jgi:hypothetical protein
MKDRLIELVSLAEQRGYFNPSPKEIVYLGSLPYTVNDAGIYVEYHEDAHAATEIIKLLIPSMSEEKIKEFVEEMEVFIKEKEKENENKESD